MMLREKLFSDIKQGLYNIDVNLKIPNNMDVYNKTKKWINKEKKFHDLTKIIEENEPNYIYIDYGHRSIKSGYMIRMLFSFNYDKKIISIKLISIFGAFWDDNHLIKEKHIVQDYYEYLIGSQDDEAIKQIYTRDDVSHILKWEVYDFVKAFIFVSLFLLLIAYIGSGNPSARNLLLGIFSCVFFLAFILDFRTYLKYKKIASTL